MLAFLVFLVAIGFGNAAMLLAQWAMIPGTVEHGEWRTGICGEGVIFGVEALAVAAVATQAQTPRALDGLWATLWKGPRIFTAMACDGRTRSGATWSR